MGKKVSTGPTINPRNRSLAAKAAKQDRAGFASRGSPLAGQMTRFDEYTNDETGRNGHHKKPKAIAVIVDHVKDENNDGAADIEDVKLFLKKNKANRIALEGSDQYPGGDFRSKYELRIRNS